MRIADTRPIDFRLRPRSQVLHLVMKARRAPETKTLTLPPQTEVHRSSERLI